MIGAGIDYGAAESRMGLVTVLRTVDSAGVSLADGMKHVVASGRGMIEAFKLIYGSVDGLMRTSYLRFGHSWFLKDEDRGRLVRTCRSCGSTLFSLRTPPPVLKQDPGADFQSPAGLKWNSPCLNVAAHVHDQ